MGGPLDLSTRSHAVDEARRIAAKAVDPFRRFLSLAVADELVLLASDALLFHRAARAALAESSLPPTHLVPIAARLGDEPANDASPRPPRRLGTREQKLVLAAQAPVRRLARYIARSIGGDAEELAAEGMLVLAEEAARWEGSIEEFVGHGFRVARDAMRYARKKEIRLKRRDVGSIWPILEAGDGDCDDVLSAIAEQVVTSEVLRFAPAAFGDRPDDQLRRAQLGRALEAARGALDAGERRLVEGFYERGEELKEIASGERWSYRTAKRHHHEALEKMHRYLVKHGHEYGRGREERAPGV